jgi:hypothetical protein
VLLSQNATQLGRRIFFGLEFWAEAVKDLAQEEALNELYLDFGLDSGFR